MAVRVGASNGPAIAAAVDARWKLHRQAKARLSGEVELFRASNPADMGVPSFSRVVDFDFRDAGEMTLVDGFEPVTDDLDW